MAQPESNEEKSAGRRKQPGTGFFGPHSRQALLTSPQKIPGSTSTPGHPARQLHNPSSSRGPPTSAPQDEWWADAQPEQPCRVASFTHGSDLASARNPAQLELLGSSAPTAPGFLQGQVPDAAAGPRAAVAGRSSSYTTGNSSRDGNSHAGLHRWWSTGAGIHQQQRQQHSVLLGSCHPTFDPAGGAFAPDLLQLPQADGTGALLQQHQSGIMRTASGGGGSIGRRSSLGSSGPVATSCHVPPAFGAPASPPPTAPLSYYGSSSLGSCGGTLRGAYGGHQGAQARISCCSSSSHSSAPLPSSPLAYSFASPASSSNTLPSVALGSSPGSNWPSGSLAGFGAGPAGNNNSQHVQQQPLLMVLEDLDDDAPPANVHELSQLLQLQQLVLGTRHAVASAQSAVVHAAASPCGHCIDTAAPGPGHGVSEAGIAAAATFSAQALAVQAGSSSGQLPTLVPLSLQQHQQAPSLFAPHLAAHIDAPASSAADALRQQQLLQLLLQQQQQEQQQQQQTAPGQTSRAVMAKLQQLIHIQSMQLQLQEELMAILPVLANE